MTTAYAAVMPRLALPTMAVEGVEELPGPEAAEMGAI